MNNFPNKSILAMRIAGMLILLLATNLACSLPSGAPIAVSPTPALSPTSIPASPTAVPPTAAPPPTPESAEVIHITSPADGNQIQGGVLTFSGVSDYFFESTLVAVLCGPGGSGTPDAVCGTSDNLLAKTPVTIQSPDVGLPGPFSGQISYNILTSTPARLSIFAVSPMDGGILHLTSVHLTLNP